jgi:NAD(P)-dependent dehydrogenase (short-subunit alcohol dehydrogenase family)
MPGLDSLRDRVAVVTGGGSGIGRALALALARDGAHVVVADMDEPGMAETCRGIRAHGREALAVITDVSDLLAVQALADAAFARFGAVHVLCNNAGVVVHGGLESMTVQDWRWVIGVNLWGVVHGLMAFLPRMIAQRQPAHVVNTASMAGLVASQGLGVYNTTKYAVVGLSETLIKDLRPYDIGVSVLCPMGVATRIRDAERARPAALRNPTDARPVPDVVLMGRTLSPEEVAEQVLDAIRTGELYVITHAEGLAPLQRRFRRMEEAIERAAARRAQGPLFDRG